MQTKHVVNCKDWKPGDKPRKGGPRPVTDSDLEQNKIDATRKVAKDVERRAVALRERAERQVLDRLIDEEIALGRVT